MAKALPANPAIAFLDALETSQIVAAEAMAKIREQFAAAEDPKVVARDLIKAGKITKWQAQQLIGGFTGLVVGNYKMLEQLGVGEMGRVYLAEHVQMQRKVALKVLAKKHTSQPQVLRRLLAEARRVAAIEHPNISHIQDVNQDGDRYFIVLEYIEADDLQKQVQQSGKLPAAKAWNIVRQTAEGLAHAHAKGIVHGGLKPSNLLVDQQGRVKILDFGLAQLASNDAGSGDSVDQVALTSKLYRAPEAGSGPAERAGDVYSLGATLCFLLTGKAPTEGPASADPIAAVAPDAPAPLVDLCRQLLAANPAHRPATEQALIAAIDAAQPNNNPVPKAAAPPAKANAPAPKASAAAPKTAAALPTAKPLPAPAADELAAKAPPPKAKKPLVAKALPSATDSGSVPAVAAETPTAAAAASDTPFGGFSLQTKGRGKTTSTAVPAAAAPAPKAAPTVEAAAAPVAAPAPAKGKKGKGKSAPGANMPLILAGGIGGGVLVLGLVIGLVIFVFNRGGKEKELAKGDGNEPAVTTPGDATGEANPPEANPVVPAESNPTIPEEANPVVPMAVPVEPMPMPATPAVEPMPMPMPMAVTPDPAKPDPTKTEPPMVATTTPDPKPEVKKPAPKPEPKPMPKPMPVGNPFDGFARSVALPKLAAGMSEPTPEMLAPVVLGPCKLPDENTVVNAVLKGGETAYSKSKMKFSIESGNGGTSLRDWDIKLQGGTVDKPVVIATLHAKNDQLTFQWEAEAAKQIAAPYLGNCVLELKAGNGKAEFGLRQPIAIEPMVIGIDKVTKPATISIDLPPEPKQLKVEILSVEGEVPKIKYDNKDLLAEKDVTYFWVGNVETEMPLCMRIETSVAGGRSVSVRAAPQFKLEGVNTRPEPFLKKRLQQLEQDVAQRLALATNALTQSSQIKDKKQRDQINQEATLAIEPLQRAKSQLDQLASLAKGLQTGGKIHFRIYANAEDGKVELATTEGAGVVPVPGPAAPGPKAPVAAPAGAGAGNPPAARPRPPAPNGAQVARAPIGTTEATAEQISSESRQLENFDTQFKGKSFRISGAVAAVQDTEVHLKGQADGLVVMKFAKKGDFQGIAAGSQVVIDGEYTQRGGTGPVFQNCEVISK